MQAKVQKWGNSLAVRIPKPFAEDIQLTSGSRVELSVQDQMLIVKRSSASGASLKTLLKGVTTKNRHNEVDTVQPVGQEIW
jgi:antitoxin MazE